MSHRVVVNEAGQHSTWPEGVELPAGWQVTGFAGSEGECLDHIAGVWTDLDLRRPGSADPAGYEATNVLEAERLALHELSGADVAQLLAVLDDGAPPERSVPGYPLAGAGFAARHFRSRTEDELQPGFGMYYLRERAGGLAFGDMGFHRPPVDGVVEVGFGLAESHRGQGYATEALVALTDWAFTQPGVERVIATTTADNAGAQGVLRRAGFRYELTEKDVLHYVLRRPVAGFARPEPMRDDEAERDALAKLGRIRKAGGDDLEFVPGSDPLRRVVRKGDRLLAYAQSGDKQGVEDPDNHLMFIVVHPAASRRGLGAALLDEVLDHARARRKKGLVTGTPDEDGPSIAWVRKHGYGPIGHHRITRREPGARLASAPADLETELLDCSDPAAVDELVALAARTVAEAQMPGGARMTSDPEELRHDLVETETGPLVVCRSQGRAVGWAVLSSLAAGEDAMVLALQVLDDDAGLGVPRALLRAAAQLADDAGAASLGAVAEESGQSELADSFADHGFAVVAGRTIWRRAVELP